MFLVNDVLYDIAIQHNGYLYLGVLIGVYFVAEEIREYFSPPDPYLAEAFRCLRASGRLQILGQEQGRTVDTVCLDNEKVRVWYFASRNKTPATTTLLALKGRGVVVVLSKMGGGLFLCSPQNRFKAREIRGLADISKADGVFEMIYANVPYLRYW